VYNVDYIGKIKRMGQIIYFISKRAIDLVAVIRIRHNRRDITFVWLLLKIVFVKVRKC